MENYLLKLLKDDYESLVKDIVNETSEDSNFMRLNSQALRKYLKNELLKHEKLKTPKEFTG